MRGDSKATHLTRVREAQLEGLRARGFHAIYYAPSFSIVVTCTQCQALVINGVATHEHGCPNQPTFCRGCDAPLPTTHTRYCEDCQ